MMAVLSAWQPVCGLPGSACNAKASSKGIDKASKAGPFRMHRFIPIVI